MITAITINRRQNPEPLKTSQICSAWRIHANMLKKILGFATLPFFKNGLPYING